MLTERTPILAAAALGLALHAGVAAQAVAVPVKGRVVDGAGKPLAKAQVAKFWIFDDGGRKAVDPMVADADGRFEGEVEMWQEKLPLMAFSEDGELAGIATVSRDEPGDTTISCGPSIRVRGTVTCEELGTKPAWINSYWMRDKLRVARCASKKAEFEVWLPKGVWRWEVYDSEFQERPGAITPWEKKPVVDLGAIDLPAGFVSRHKGKPLPTWNVTDARGVDAEHAQIGDFKGKWLLIELWGYW